MPPEYRAVFDALKAQAAARAEAARWAVVDRAVGVVLAAAAVAVILAL